MGQQIQSPPPPSNKITTGRVSRWRWIRGITYQNLTAVEAEFLLSRIATSPSSFIKPGVSQIRKRDLLLEQVTNDDLSMGMWRVHSTLLRRPIMWDQTVLRAKMNGSLSIVFSNILSTALCF